MPTFLVYRCMNLPKLCLIAIAFLFYGEANGQFITQRLERGVEAHRAFKLRTADTVLADVLVKKELLTRPQYGELLYFYCRNLLLLSKEEGEGRIGFLDPKVQGRFFQMQQLILTLERENIPRWSVKSDLLREEMTDPLHSATVACLKQLEEESSALEIAQNYNDLTMALSPVDYTAFELKGQIEKFRGNDEEAHKLFEQAIKLFRKKRSRSSHNMRFPRVFYMQAVNHLENGDRERAYRKTKLGFFINELEWKALKKNSGSFIKTPLEDYEPIYLKNLYDIGLLEIELAVEFAPRDSVILLYSQREKYYQKEYSFNFNYGQILQTENPNQAAKYFQTAINIEPKRADAYFALGNLYFAMGQQYDELAQKDKKSAADHTERAERLYNVSLPYLQNAYVLNKKNKNALILLQKATERLEMEEQHKMYTGLLKNL